MCVSAISGVGADDSFFAGMLIWGIEELVGSGTCTEDGIIFEHSKGGVPTVDAFEV